MEKAVGRGGFGKVYLVQEKQDKEWYAMKEMLKARVMLKDSIESVLNELHFLQMIDHKDRSSKFIANVHYAF